METRQRRTLLITTLALIALGLLATWVIPTGRTTHSDPCDGILESVKAECARGGSEISEFSCNSKTGAFTFKCK